MTVDELIAALTALSADGKGAMPVVTGGSWYGHSLSPAALDVYRGKVWLS